MVQHKPPPPLDLGTNVAQIFTELYRKYGLLDNPPSVVFENSLYAEGEQAVSILSETSDRLRHFHAREGTLELFYDPSQPAELQPFCTGCGSTQLFNALLYAMSETFPDKTFLVTQKIPYFGSHRSAANLFQYPNLRYMGYHTPADLPPRAENEVRVEFVTSPNNPDGAFRRPETDPDVIIGDFVFTSDAFGPDGTGYIPENLQWVRAARQSGTTLLSYNSASKQFGHTGDRVGYMWFPLHDPFAAQIFDKTKRFISTSVGVGLLGLNHFANLLPGLNEKGRRVRREANRALVARHRSISRALLRRYPGSTDASVPGGATLFATLEDARIPAMSAAEVVLHDTGTTVLPGSDFGGTDDQIRVNVMATTFDVEEFVRRLGVRASSKQHAAARLPEGRRVDACEARFTATPGVGEIVATCGCTEVVLPPFLGFEGPVKIRIRNKSRHTLRVADSRRELRLRIEPCKHVDVEWVQPYYRNGRWVVSRCGGDDKNRNEDRKKRVQLPRASKDETRRHFVV